MAFKDNTLTFSDTKIVEDSTDMEVMMSWEAPIMEKSAEYVCQSKGDILEIGFGMGICSDYIQAQGVNSHTIVEIHPQIIEKLNIWASDKSNVTVVEGDWNTVNGLSTYDGIFIDTYGDENWSKFKDFVLAKAKSGAKVTYWNSKAEENNEHSFDSISFEQVSITPDSNSYLSSNTYYMPKVVI
tara:strand:+ start:2954 stop:3505 length:552 start_codon:yes stop_codon:yes gene_type:complete